MATCSFNRGDIIAFPPEQSRDLFKIIGISDDGQTVQLINLTFNTSANFTVEFINAYGSIYDPGLSIPPPILVSPGGGCLLSLLGIFR